MLPSMRIYDADRQPEFTQIDLETSFLNENEIMDITEGMVKQIFHGHHERGLGDFPRMLYSEAMFKYGSDKPICACRWHSPS